MKSSFATVAVYRIDARTGLSLGENRLSHWDAMDGKGMATRRFPPCAQSAAGTGTTGTGVLPPPKVALKPTLTTEIVG